MIVKNILVTIAIDKKPLDRVVGIEGDATTAASLTNLLTADMVAIISRNMNELSMEMNEIHLPGFYRVKQV